jgi:AcrR family transcriptional regulator
VHDSLNPADLLLQASLEAVLNRTPGRHDSAARLERVKAAALMECAEKGYGALTVSAIAKRAKVSTASIYSAYVDRDALLVAAMEMLFSILAEDEIVIPDHPDPRQRVEQLLVAHGLVYLQPLTLWTFRLHMMLAWAGHEHLREIGQRVFQGIDAFWRGFLGDLVSTGQLVAMDLDLVVPWLLAPVERATILARLTCGDAEDVGPSYLHVARHGAESLFELWGSDSWRASTDATPSSSPTPPGDVAPPLTAGPTPGARLGSLFARTPHRQFHKTRRERIGLAAATVCHEKGYNAASMQDVALRARVSTASIYKEFADKADLFTNALADELEFRIQPGHDVAGAAGEERPSRDRVGDALISHLNATASADTHEDLAWIFNIIMASEISGTPRVAALARADRLEREARVADLVCAIQPDRPLAPSDLELVVNRLLAPVERAGLLSLLLFGRQALDHNLLSGIASFTVHNQMLLMTAARRP